MTPTIANPNNQTAENTNQTPNQATKGTKGTKRTNDDNENAMQIDAQPATNAKKATVDNNFR